MRVHCVLFVLLAVVAAVPALAEADILVPPGCGAVPARSAETRAEVVALAAKEGAAALIAPAAPVGDDGGATEETHACWGRIQPGARMTSPAGCTMNWVFRDETGALYVGTAGHCIGATGSNGRSVSLWGTGVIGTSAFNVNAGIGRDFGLVRIDPAKYGIVDPTLCHWGGPSSVAAFTPTGGIASDTRPVLQYGFGVVFNTAAVSRARVHEMQGVSSSSFGLEGTISSGDSGSPVMLTDGSAAGVVTHGIVGVPGAFVIGPGYAGRIDRALELAEASTGHDFTLVTSPRPVAFPLGTM